jgi:hypothetical protein
MKAIKLLGSIDEQHRLQAQVPDGVPAGPVRVVVFLPEEDDGGTAWMRGLAAEWVDDFGDPRQDIYTLEDGLPLDVRR